MTKRLAIIDGKSVFYRGYYAMPNLSLQDGTPIGGVFGFASIAIEIIKKLEPDYIAIAWDIKGTSTAKRTEIFADYKAGRTKPPDDFYAQLPALREVLEAFNWPLYELDNYEADDIIGTFALQANEADVEACIISGDYDMLQLIAPKTSVYITKKGGMDLTNYDASAFTEKYGVRVDQFVDYKALVGDKSDNIPGVRKIGPKAAESLLGAYDTLDGIYGHVNELKGAQKDNIIADKEAAYMSQQLAQIYTDAPITIDWDEMDIDNTDLAKVATVLKRFEFTSLLKRLPKHMQQTVDAGLHFEVAHQANLAEVAWPSTVSIESPVMIYLDDDILWISPNNTTAYQQKIESVDVSMWRALEFATVVSYDIKALYHQLAAKGIIIQFGSVHDIRQAAFLIDPLRRDRSLQALSDSVVEAPLEYCSALWKVYAWQTASFEHMPRVAEVARTLDFPVISPLFLMEHRGIRITAPFLVSMSEELHSEHVLLEQEMYTLSGYEFNIGSPAQLSDVLFTKLQLPTAGVKKGKTGYSTDQKTLDKLRGQHPIIELIERTRELAKLQNTYVDVLPKLADENGRIHTTYSQDIAATGRLSSNHPNLQNIPVRTEIGRRIREAFIPNEGKVFVSADYSQFELRLAAVLAGDQELIDDFNSGIDVHTKTASDVYGVPINEVTKAQRRDAKVINFGVLYGMSPHGLAAATGMSFTAAKQFIDQYFSVRAPIRQYIDATLEQARTEGYVETYYGRRRPTPDIHSSNFIVRQSAERAAANMPIQGTEADLMKRAMLVVEERLAGKADQLLQVHDSILVECLPEDVDEVSQILKTSMETIAPELAINLNVDVSIGDNWGVL